MRISSFVLSVSLVFAVLLLVQSQASISYPQFQENGRELRNRRIHFRHSHSNRRNKKRKQKQSRFSSSPTAFPTANPQILRDNFSYAPSLSPNQSVKSPGVKKNILLIIADDWRYSTVTVNDSTSTPNLNAFKKKSVTFEFAFCNVPLCAPSRSSFLSGLEPTEISVISDAYIYQGISSPNATENLPSFLKNRGYNTFTVGKVFHNIDPNAYSPDVWTNITLPALQSQDRGYLVTNCIANELGKEDIWKSYKDGSQMVSPGLLHS